MVEKTIRQAALFVAIFSLAVAFASAGQAKTDISGAWTFEVVTDAGTGTPTVTFKQDGEKLTGHYSSQTLGEADLTGTVKGADVTFNFMADLQGNAVPVTYKATIESPTSMKGTIDIGGLAGGTFTGKKK
jgi:hypothetical protein